MKVSLTVGSWLNDARSMGVPAFRELVGAIARCDDAEPDDEVDFVDPPTAAESGTRFLCVDAEIVELRPPARRIA